MKTGLVWEDHKLAYYKAGKLFHAGVVQVGDDIYCFDSDGYAVKGWHTVCEEESNDILPAGRYRFGKNYKLRNNPLSSPDRGRMYYLFVASGLLSTAMKLLVCAFVLFGILFFVKRYEQNYFGHLDEKVEVVEQIVDRSPILPEFDEEVSLCSAYGLQLYNHEVSVADIQKYGDPYRPFSFQYKLWDNDGILRVSEDSNLVNAKEYVLPVDETVLLIDNLKTGTEYFYQVVVDGETVNGSFKTAKSTRFVSIPGVINARDIGGYTNLDGKTVKQGLLIRGSEIDGLAEEQVETLQDTFGFVYDFDLRMADVYAGEYVSPLGESVGHKFYSTPMVEEIFVRSMQSYLWRITRDLAKSENYPMYLHCSDGADQTGMIVFLLQGILNMSEEDMFREYQMSGFTDASFADSDQMNIIIDGIDRYYGDTLSQQIVNFLVLEIGVPWNDIALIRSYFLEG